MGVGVLVAVAVGVGVGVDVAVTVAVGVWVAVAVGGLAAASASGGAGDEVLGTAAGAGLPSPISEDGVVPQPDRATARSSRAIIPSVAVANFIVKVSRVPLPYIVSRL